ncbi:MAG: PEP/pyruvate-binding domain-containing protein, partial [Desulfonatronovibrionaceae bacterium]
ITSRAFNLLVSQAGIRPEINRILSRICLESAEDFQDLSLRLQNLILEAEVPSQVQEEIESRLEKFQGNRLAVRSSAVGEDSFLSFAGQYRSILDTAREDFYTAYKQVLASKYSPRAITYRIRAGMADELLPMAVLVLEMVDALESGVVYTEDIKDSRTTGIYVVSGQGEQLVSGQVKAREYFIDRNSPQDNLPEEPAYLAALYQKCLNIEQIFEQPQDIEWAVDRARKILFLQTRPLRSIKPDNSSPGLDLPVLARGEWAGPGLASGRIHILSSKEKISDIPPGCILVAPALYPELTQALGVMEGVIAARGSQASHFANIARENSVPVIINVDQATEIFENQQLVTMDGHRALIHAGQSQPGSLPRPEKETWLKQKMRVVLENISSLNLKDAESEDFIPQNCRSMHDLIRFTHEMGVREMFALADRKGRGLHQSKTLDLDIPLVFRVLNLEQGLTSKGETLNRVTLDHVTCRPFLAMFQGLRHPRIPWDKNIKHFDWEGFDQVSAGIFDPAKSTLLSSYGLLARDYMHALIRFGYHFVVVDALLSPENEQNYIQFSFKGGGAKESQRLMRLQVIKAVLEKFGFSTETRGDMLKAEYSREDADATERRLKVVGYILGITRLKDMSINQDKVQQLINSFSGEIHDFLAG